MSIRYEIFFDCEKPIEEVRKQLKELIGAPLELVEDWEHWDMYSTQVLGLKMQLRDYRENSSKLVGGDLSSYTYQLLVYYIRELTGLSEGKVWMETANVEIARMIARNLKCRSIFVADDVITHRFELETQE